MPTRIRPAPLLLILLLSLHGCAQLRVDPMHKVASADAAYQAGDWQRAEALYKELLAHQPDYDEGWFRLGNLYLRQHEARRAESAFAKATALSPGESRYWHNRTLAILLEADQLIDHSRAVFPPGSEDDLTAGSLQQGLRRRVAEAP